ncbi:c-type cytochrome [Natranaerobius trueperi]|uniref:Cytochrome c domain-containing protein n=1 Tax=Natranaerobius trueperi TaxID=759412 RepID=A0A226BWI9_9FIRM|nr:c-type cytochrome [Natranaerobius trueperi]OWZ83281.1 hypothetical protein CDO51_09485 [Natranaerobius trueperi]
MRKVVYAILGVLVVGLTIGSFVGLLTMGPRFIGYDSPRSTDMFGAGDRRYDYKGEWFFKSGRDGASQWPHTDTYDQDRRSGTYLNNGQRIYFSSASKSSIPVQARIGAMPMTSPMISCADCHGSDGSGSTIQTRQGEVNVPDIRYEQLSSNYTRTELKKVIRDGVDPEGNSYDWPMPNWVMSPDDYEDLLDYLETKSIE